MIDTNILTPITAAAVTLSVCYVIIGVLERALAPVLKHLQVYQVARAQFRKPYVEDDTSIQPVYTNQLGNNLFQYAYARLRARYLGKQFLAGPLNQDVFHDDIARLASSQKQEKVSSPFEKASPFEHLETEKNYAKKTSSDSDVSDAQRRSFLSETPNAFGQDFKFYERDADTIREWMCPSVESHEKEASRAAALGVDRDDTIVFHLRFAGAVEGWFADPTYHELPMSYYTDVLRRHGHCKRAVLVHEPKSKVSAAEVARQLKLASPSVEIIMQCASRCEDFMVMYKSRHLALSVSTFAWWAGFLGDKTKTTVYYPKHAAMAFYNPRRLKCWYNKLMPMESIYCPIEYTTAPKSTRRADLSKVRSFTDLAQVSV
uniref:L-Fucosyltransferase n=1 Tax=Lotharella oceanica TaxID=641309 RepID=A0A7S2TRX5_9EUKA|mmetsp:Transcript_24557/g.45915  ORF Transcript_24557/g.45915 Transcript_24557/m.45915 type:complete len:374 (+) Transcript_24557:68-1189(+)|eukprot:CAMPEP_0170183168 /NCGR_PEP_ID=MMETSP0040_2-20121228/29818_1 /TAXON_ID=641309 /ORGANISM="Lotharella oceanica, Strain CCMP622" /LENGTH=373 /DNA_ID=CAMNT_0010428813 /DNA_START=62 /DNA_END=1183 /DNA_ORIENTATION=+